MTDLPTTLSFHRDGDFPDYKPMSDTDWQAYWQWMCVQSHEWAQSCLTPINDEEE